MNVMFRQNPVTLESIAESIGDISVRMGRLEGLIDGLAIATSNEFGKLRIRLDDMDNNLIDFRKDVDFKFTGLQNQLDNIYINYTRRDEFASLDKRVKKVEKVVFA